VARLEGRITLETLLTRMPAYHVDLGAAKRLRTEFVQGFSSLPIRWERTHTARSSARSSM
jgi:cytochrome P450